MQKEMENLATKLRAFLRDAGIDAEYRPGETEVLLAAKTRLDDREAQIVIHLGTASKEAVRYGFLQKEAARARASQIAAKPTLSSRSASAEGREAKTG